MRMNLKNENIIILSNRFFTWSLIGIAIILLIISLFLH
jgi:hypothetical protein